MDVRRTAALAVTAMVLVAGALTGGTTGAAGQAAERETAASMIAVSIDKAGAVTMPAVVAPGVNTYKITTARRSSALQVVALAPGYTTEQADADVVNGLEKGRLKALKRFEANTTLLGGATATKDKAGKLAIDLAPGTYYALDTSKSGSPWTLFTVSGVDTGATLPADTRVTAIDSTKWSKKPAAIPRKGWLKFKNRSDQNHFISLVKLLPGKTLDDFAAFLESESGPPPIDFGVTADSGVLSPGHDMAMKYRLARGNYVLVCFWPDASMGGMPHAFMGMYRMVKVR
jgi:hypothetical protein